MNSRQRISSHPSLDIGILPTIDVGMIFLTGFSRLTQKLLRIFFFGSVLHPESMRYVNASDSGRGKDIMAAAKSAVKKTSIKDVNRGDNLPSVHSASGFKQDRPI